jgi:hypothetical protein
MLRECKLWVQPLDMVDNSINRSKHASSWFFVIGQCIASPKFFPGGFSTHEVFPFPSFFTLAETPPGTKNAKQLFPTREKPTMAVLATLAIHSHKRRLKSVAIVATQAQIEHLSHMACMLEKKRI